MRIEVNQNLDQWALFSHERTRLAKKLGRQPIEKLLFNGTKQTDPQTIIGSDEGLNINYAGSGSRWGKAVYFAKNASYSLDRFAHAVDDPFAHYTSGKSFQIFLAHVLIGDTIEMDSDSTLREPPLKANQIDRYDSVQGYTGGSKVYMVYASRKALAKYLITYQLK